MNERMDSKTQGRSIRTEKQGPNGLVQVVTDSINAMMELRMWLEYGTSNLIPKSDGQTWIISVFSSKRISGHERETCISPIAKQFFANISLAST